jgi:hypothetical protein
VLAVQTAAEARPRVLHHYEADAIARQSGRVTAESRYGNGSVTAPVRRTQAGWQVRLPRGGGWVDCKRSCTNTLRISTVDWWEAQDGINNMDGGPNYFSWEFHF